MAKSLHNDVGEGTAVDERGEASLFGKQGVAALAMARAEPDPDSLGAARRLRAHFSPELAAAALSQVALRRRAHAKFGDQAAHMWFTSAGLEQASRPAVAAWRARRLAAAGCTQVLDLGCGIGADAMAFAAAGLHVHAVELDAITANLARANLASWPHAQVITGDVIDLTPRLLADYPTAAIFIDPARRTAQGRSWKMADLTPQWDFVLSLLGAGRICCIKLGPGLPAELIPDDVQAVWVSEHGDVVEAGLWRLPGMHGSRAGLLLPGEHWLDRPDHPRELPVRAPGRYLYEPDGAVIRAGALTEIAPDSSLWLLASGVAYLSSDELVTTPLATAFEIDEILDFHESSLRAWVRANQVGVLEIKKRGIQLDPATLRRRLKPAGPRQATLIISRTVEGTRAMVVTRVEGTQDQPS